jgi:hypothetical protein
MGENIEDRELKGKKTKTPTSVPTVVVPTGTKKPTEKRRELKAKKSKPTAKPTSEPTVQATFPHGTASPVEKRRSLKKSSTDEVFGKFSPGHETHNPTPSQFHPTKKPSHDDRRELKKNKKPTSEPTVQATFPHGTASPVEKRRSMKVE